VRKIVAAPFVSLDGVVEMSEQWTIPYFTADMQQVIQQGMAAADTMLMGRRTYEQMAAYWPSMTATDDPFAEFLNNSPKLVVSTTLQSVDWQNATLITNDVIGEVARRKQQPGKDILIPGSATLVRCLLHEGWSTSCGCCCSRSSWAAASASLTAGPPGCGCGSWGPRRSTAGSSRSSTSQRPSKSELPIDQFIAVAIAGIQQVAPISAWRVPRMSPAAVNRSPPLNFGSYAGH
jgi:dihydrofolate reductase